MDALLRQELMDCETDLDGALRRFSNNEALYLACLDAFLKDQSIPDLEAAMRDGDRNGAFAAAHAFKGLAGNMGFLPLFHAAAELVICIREGKTARAEASFAELKQCYDRVASTIRRHCGADRKGVRI